MLTIKYWVNELDKLRVSRCLLVDIFSFIILYLGLTVGRKDQIHYYAYIKCNVRLY